MWHDVKKFYYEQWVGITGALAMWLPANRVSSVVGLIRTTGQDRTQTRRAVWVHHSHLWRLARQRKHTQTRNEKLNIRFFMLQPMRCEVLFQNAKATRKINKQIITEHRIEVMQPASSQIGNQIASECMQMVAVWVSCLIWSKPIPHRKSCIVSLSVKS